MNNLDLKIKEISKSEFIFEHMTLEPTHEEISKEYNLLEHFFTFLRNENNNCYDVLCGYFYQVFKFLIFKEQEIILDILFKKNKLHINNMICLSHNTSICKCIFEILNCNFKQKMQYILYQEYICLELINYKIYNEKYTVPICENIFIPLFRNNDFYLSSTMITNFNFKEVFFTSFFSKIQPLKIIHLSIVKLCNMIANAIYENLQITNNKKQENETEVSITKLNNAFDSFIEVDRQVQLGKSLQMNQKEIIIFLKETSHTIIEYLNEINYTKYFDMIYVIEYLTKCFNIFNYYLNQNNSISDNENDFDSQNIFKTIFTENLYLMLTIKLLENPRNNIYHTAYIELITSLQDQTDILINKNVINRYMSYLVNIYPKHRELLAPVVKIISIIFEKYDSDNNNNIEDKLKTDCLNLKQFAEPVNDLFMENPKNLEFDEDMNIVFKTHEHTLDELINNGITTFLKSGFDGEEEAESESLSEEFGKDNEEDKNNDINIKEDNIKIEDNVTEQKVENDVIQNKEDSYNKINSFTDSFYWKSNYNLIENEQDLLNELIE